uniref:peptidylprolyl isomerase n=1 Tax=Callorhinchus milii TaxID=7868 RepID=A0A4W3IMN9_CALMI
HPPHPPDCQNQPHRVILQTTMGVTVMELYLKHAPKTCYYDGTKFLRIIKQFIIQGGDLTGTDLKFTGAGIHAMANTEPEANGRQFFISLGPTQWLDGKHTIFGHLHNGPIVGLLQSTEHSRKQATVAAGGGGGRE